MFEYRFPSKNNPSDDWKVYKKKLDHIFYLHAVRLRILHSHNLMTRRQFMHRFNNNDRFRHYLCEDCMISVGAFVSRLGTVPMPWTHEMDAKFWA